jgi:hypothetical protein
VVSGLGHGEGAWEVGAWGSGRLSGPLLSFFLEKQEVADQIRWKFWQEVGGEEHSTDVPMGLWVGGGAGSDLSSQNPRTVLGRGAGIER